MLAYLIQYVSLYISFSCNFLRVLKITARSSIVFANEAEAADIALASEEFVAEPAVVVRGGRAGAGAMDVAAAAPNEEATVGQAEAEDIALASENSMMQHTCLVGWGGAAAVLVAFDGGVGGQRASCCRPAHLTRPKWPKQLSWSAPVKMQPHLVPTRAPVGPHGHQVRLLPDWRRPQQLLPAAFIGIRCGRVLTGADHDSCFRHLGRVRRAVWNRRWQYPVAVCPP